MTGEWRPRPSPFVIVRHGATEWSENGRHTGVTDLPLTREGARQAAASGASVNAAVADIATAVIYASPLQRALSSARLALPTRSAQVTDLLVEWDYGEYEGKTTEEIRETRPGWDIYADGCPGGEDLAGVTERCRRFVEVAADAAGDGALVCFTHGHLSRVLTAVVLGLECRDAAVLYNDTASVAVCTWRRDRYVLMAWNRTTG